jgi:hypothetical protein
VLLVVATGTATADVVYPARLTMEETEPGTFDVTFTLPIVEGRKLRAEPLMPPTCSDLGQREISVSSAGHTTIWTTVCDPPSLIGEAILVEGLLGTQTELAFTLSTLDGRVFNEILKPSRPGFLVPQPPDTVPLAIQAAVEGLRRTARQLPLWLLVFIVVALGAPTKELVGGTLGFLLAHGLAQWLGGHDWLSVHTLARDGGTLVSVAIPAVALAGRGAGWQGWVRPFLPLAVLLGLLYGGAQPETLPPDGLSYGERGLVLAAFSVGTGIGLLLISLVAVEVRTVVQCSGGTDLWRAFGRLTGYAVGSLAVGMIMARSVAAVLLAGDLRATTSLVLLALVIGWVLPFAGRGAWPTTAIFGVLCSIGIGLGLGFRPLPADDLVVTGSLLILGCLLAADRRITGWWGLAGGAVAVVGTAWYLGSEMLATVSRSTGVAAGVVLTAICVHYASVTAARHWDNGSRPGWSRVLGGAVAVVAVLWRMDDYLVWFDTRLATDAALGAIRIPMLSAILLLVAVLGLRRRRRVTIQSDLQGGQRPIGSWLMLTAAFLLIPHGTVAVRIPFFDARAPEGDAARRVVTSVLWETYRAFNLQDEDELFDTLEANLTADLVDDIYLDSRRRLMAGTREGAQVTVREVKVLDIGDPRTPPGSGGFEYDCRWAVTARVSHLKHVHLRQNTYSGWLTLVVDDDRWKIAGIDLQSEDRVVLWAAKR